MNIPEYEIYIQSYSWLPIVSVLLFLLSVALFESLQNKFISLLSLSLGAFALFSFMALADPFLHDWDEQYHALVAKNMINHFFTPTLLENPILYYNEIGGSAWIGTHIWIHKQPFFLWQMALSMKVFGVNLFAMRLPSILMASLIPILIYRIGTIIKSKYIGFYAALVFLASDLTLSLVSGRLNTDHNDVAFLFYITASFWAWFEYKRSKNTKWLYLIGLLSGIAILVKWLVGLIVYAGWGLSVLLDSENRAKVKSFFNIAKSLLITIIVALPWQLYILWRFPRISRFEYAYNSKHLWKAVEGHDGDWLYHFHRMDSLFTPYFNYLILIVFIGFLFIKIDRKYKIAITSWVFIVYAFFSIAATKMPAFTVIVAPLLFIILASVIFQILDALISNKRSLMFVRIFLVIIGFYSLFNFGELNNKPDWRAEYWKQFYTEVQSFEKIDAMNLSGNSRFFNFYHYGSVRFMFQTNYQSRKFIPKKEEIETLKKADIEIYIFDNGKLPDYIIKDQSITKIISPIWPDSQVEDLIIYR